MAIHPSGVVLITIALPFLIVLTLLAPVYLSLGFGLAWLYGSQMLDLLGHPWALLDAYYALYHYWLEHRAEVSFFEFTLPAIMFPLLGILLGLFFVKLLIDYVHDVIKVD